MKLYVLEAFLPHIIVHDLDHAIAHWTSSNDPAGFQYLLQLQQARASGTGLVIEDLPGDPLNVAEVFSFDEWPRIVDDFDLRRFLKDPAGPLTIDVYPDELRALLD